MQYHWLLFMLMIVYIYRASKRLSNVHRKQTCSKKTVVSTLPQTLVSKVNESKSTNICGKFKFGLLLHLFDCSAIAFASRHSRWARFCLPCSSSRTMVPRAFFWSCRNVGIYVARYCSQRTLGCRHFGSRIVSGYCGCEWASRVLCCTNSQAPT